MKIGHDAAEFGTSGQLLSQQNLASQTECLFGENDPVATFRSDGCSLHARRSTACHDHGPRHADRRLVSVLQFPTGFRVLDTGDAMAGLHVTDTGLIAGNARPDIVDAPGTCLVGHVRIGNLGPGHPCHIGLAGGDDCLGILGLIDPAGDKHWNRHQLLHGGGQRRQVGVGDVHRRHHVDRSLETGHGAGDDIDVVESTGVAEPPAHLEQFFGVVAFGLHLVTGDPHADDHRWARMIAYAGNDLFEEPHAVRQRAAIGILASVHGRIEELCRQKAVAGEDLDAVQSGPLHASGGAAVGSDKFADHGEREGAGRGVRTLCFDLGGTECDALAAVGGCHAIGAGMTELAEDHAAVAMDGIGGTPVGCDAGVTGCIKIAPAAACVDPCRFGDDEARATPCTGFVIGDKALVRQHVRIEQTGHVTGREDAVAKRLRPDAKRRKEVRETVRHGAVSPDQVAFRRLCADAPGRPR